MWPRSVRPDAELEFIHARLETVIRRNGFVLEPVVWQIVIFAGGVLVGCGVSDADGQAPVPTTITSPLCRK
jgi:hypothetical protein